MTTGQSVAIEPPRGPSGEPAMTTSARRLALDEMRFLDIRHLAYQFYKKPDQSPLLTYEETLRDRDAVKRTVLEFEIKTGRLIPDGTENLQPQPVAQPQTTQGEQQMNAPFAPVPNGAPVPQQQQMFAPPGQVPQAPQMQQPLPPAAPPMFAGAPQMPPQQMQQVPQMQAPVPQQPQAQVQAPPQQEAPVAAPQGRKRRSAGTAVAPPPTAVGLPPVTPVQQQPQQNLAPQFVQPLQAAPPMFAPQGAPTQFAPQVAAPVPQMQAQQPQMAAPAVDLSPLLGAINELKGIVINANQRIENLEKQNAELRTLELSGLTVLHHMYLTHPSFAASVQDKKTLPEFIAHLAQYIPR